MIKPGVDGSLTATNKPGRSQFFTERKCQPTASSDSFGSSSSSSYGSQFVLEYSLPHTATLTFSGRLSCMCEHKNVRMSWTGLHPLGSLVRSPFNVDWSQYNRWWALEGVAHKYKVLVQTLSRSCYCYIAVVISEMNLPAGRLCCGKEPLLMPVFTQL